MNKLSPEISLFFGGFGLLFVLFAALETACNCLLPSLIFVLFHFIMVAVAFPFFLYSIFVIKVINRKYLYSVGIISVLNAILMIITSSIDPSLTNLFYVAAYLEFLPLPFLIGTFNNDYYDQKDLASDESIAV